MEKTINYKSAERAASVRLAVKNSITYVLLALWGVLVLFPFYWMLLTSIKGYGAYNAEYIPKFYTLAPTIQNYIDAFTTVSLGRYFLNTMIFICSAKHQMIENHLLVGVLGVMFHQ